MKIHLSFVILRRISENSVQFSKFCDKFYKNLEQYKHNRLGNKYYRNAS